MAAPKKGRVKVEANAARKKEIIPNTNPLTKESLPASQNFSKDAPTMAPIKAVIIVGINTPFVTETSLDSGLNAQRTLSGPKANKIPPKTKVTKNPIKAPRHMYLLTNSLLNKVVISALSNKGESNFCL